MLFIVRWMLTDIFSVSFVARALLIPINNECIISYRTSADRTNYPWLRLLYYTKLELQTNQISAVPPSSSGCDGGGGGGGSTTVIITTTTNPSYRRSTNLSRTSFFPQHTREREKKVGNLHTFLCPCAYTHSLAAASTYTSPTAS